MTTGETGDSLDWRDGVPISCRFDDPYYSLDNGLAETRHVFLDGNGLPDRFCTGFHIAELGFGTGLNCAAALQAWLDSGQTGVLHYTAFEAYPLRPDDAATALAAFPELGAAIDILKAAMNGESGPLALSVIEGDANATLPAWTGRADAWFLDGFSPAKNPELWNAGLMAHVARHTAPEGTFATYTAAGHVRRALDKAGFRVTRVPGFGRKRHMTTGILA